MKPWERIEPTVTTKVGWRTITTKNFKLPDGRTAAFDLLHPDGQVFVNVIALTSDNKVVIARQFRPGPEAIYDELPGGFVDEGESPEIAVLRELKEETGYVPTKMTLLGSYQKDTYMNATWYGFLAQGCIRQSDATPEGVEDIEVDSITITQLIENAKNGKMTDQQTVLMAYDTLKELED
jgi:ADP-ribose pyrophosphatase